MGCHQSDPQFTITTTDATPLGSVALTLRASSGSLAHEVTLALVTVPLVTTSQQGTVLYLLSRANGHAARIGLDTAWGGAIVEVSMDGTNFVNRHDTGREVQPALYDGAASYPDLAPGSAYGWDPVLAGDAYGRGSAVPMYTVSPGSLYTQAYRCSGGPIIRRRRERAGRCRHDYRADGNGRSERSARVQGALQAHPQRLGHALQQRSEFLRLCELTCDVCLLRRRQSLVAGSHYDDTDRPGSCQSLSPAGYAPELWGAPSTVEARAWPYVPGQYPYENAWGFANQSGSAAGRHDGVHVAGSLFHGCSQRRDRG